MFLPRGPGSGAVEVRMGGDLDVQVEGGAAALVIQTKPLLKFMQNQLFSFRCCTNNPNQTFAKIYTRTAVLYSWPHTFATNFEIYNSSGAAALVISNKP
jgi:hypothetical protein